MHRLLMERGTVIESLIATKGTSRPGAAFRPMREAEMMRRLVARHAGALPLATVEHIWREIITTFTRMQAPFNVAIDVSVEPERTRDLARFVFGFSVDLIAVEGAETVVARVARDNDLGIVARKAAGGWWAGLKGEGAPRIIALLPFIAAEGRPADLPAFVISPALADETPPDIAVAAVAVDGRLRHVEGCEILASAVTEEGAEYLMAAPAGTPLAETLTTAGVAVRAVSPVGGFARGIAIGGGETLLYAAGREGGTP
jgi:chorismate mutase